MRYTKTTFPFFVLFGCKGFDSIDCHKYPDDRYPAGGRPISLNVALSRSHWSGAVPSGPGSGRAPLYHRGRKGVGFADSLLCRLSRGSGQNSTFTLCPPCLDILFFATGIHGRQAILKPDNLLVLCKRAGKRTHRGTPGALQKRGLRTVPGKIPVLHPDGEAGEAWVCDSGITRGRMSRQAESTIGCRKCSGVPGPDVDPELFHGTGPGRILPRCRGRILRDSPARTT